MIDFITAAAPWVLMGLAVAILLTLMNDVLVTAKKQKTERQQARAKLQTRYLTTGMFGGAVIGFASSIIVAPFSVVNTSGLCMLWGMVVAMLIFRYKHPADEPNQKKKRKKGAK